MTEKTYTLRPYQSESTDASINYMENPGRSRGGLVVAPTGSGKSLVIAEIALRLEGRTIVFQPSLEILWQNYAKFVSYGHAPAVWSASAGSKQKGRITLATIGSVVRHPEIFADVRNVIIDEGHLVNAKQGMYRKFLELTEGARVLGLTATPYRLATNSLGSELRFLTRTRPRVFDELVHTTQIPDLFKAGYLCPLKYKVVPVIDRTRLEINSTGADYTPQSVEKAYKSVGMVERLVVGCQRLIDAGRKHIVVFTSQVETAEKVAEGLGDLAETVSAKTTPRERKRILQGFQAGKFRVCVNVNVIALGFDFPRLDTVVLAAPTRSLSRYYQQIGRAVRPHKSKDSAAIVDMVGNVAQFGPIEDMVLRPGGKSGKSWAVWSGKRQLTNKRFADQAWL